MMDLDLAQLEALSAAVAEGTFDAAAAALHVTPSAFSPRNKALELSVGQVLLTRSKPIRPTPSGQALLRLARQIQTMTADVARELGGETVPNTPTVIPLAVNADSLATWVLPALATLGPPLVFDLHREDQEQTADLLRQGTVMAAVTASADPVPGCTVERLGRMRYRPLASADFAARWFPEGVTTQALSLAPVVIFDRQDHLQDRYLKRRTRRRLDPPRHYVPASAEFVEAVRLGLGWAMLPDLQTATGAELIDLDPQGWISVHLYWQQWRLHSAALDRVASAIRRAAKTELR
ncbi:MAG: LysR family transcriptional regulator, chromosome initiation inhibitor [Pseudonocardiales bacterium]|nr:LysR family transcriptional regulator, chromosome initiation inhibitor [Pseudonocardiales bacterium]